MPQIERLTVIVKEDRHEPAIACMPLDRFERDERGLAPDETDTRTPVEVDLGHDDAHISSAPGQRRRAHRDVDELHERVERNLLGCARIVDEGVWRQVIRRKNVEESRMEQ